MIDRARERECLNVFIYLQMLVVKILILLAGKFNLLYFFSFLFPGRVLNAFMHHITVPTQCYDHMQILQKFKSVCVCSFFFALTLFEDTYEEEKGRGDTCWVGIHGVEFVVCVTGEWKRG